VSRVTGCALVGANNGIFDGPRRIGTESVGDHDQPAEGWRNGFLRAIPDVVAVAFEAAPDMSAKKTGGISMADPKPGSFQKEQPGIEKFLEPLDFVAEQHDRQLDACRRLINLAEEPNISGAAEEAAYLSVFLSEELRVHTDDEENDLFPLLEKRCRPEDGMDRIFDQLRAEHSFDAEIGDIILSDLEAIAWGRKLSDSSYFRINARAFAEIQRRHIMWENHVILPLARRRLTPTDLAELGSKMMARRSLASTSLSSQ
jgi:hemerythrin-like domain-containing protein